MIDPLDGDWDPTAYWSTSNVGEAVPGVLTPLNWSLWKRGGEAGLRAALVAVGALERRHGRVPLRDRNRVMGLFHGRLAANVDFMGRMGDRLPATSGAAIAEQLLGRLPEDFVSRPTSRRLPAIAAAYPRAAAAAPKEVRRVHDATGPWWSSHIARAPRLNRDEARALWRLAADRFVVAMSTHITCVFATVQPAHDGIVRLCAAAGRPDLVGRLTAGLGNHAEVDVVADLWAVSRDRISLDEFLARHGYHGHDEGEIASRVWRENPHPVEQLLDQYRDRDESPAQVVRTRAVERSAAEAELMAALPRWQHGPAQGLLHVAARVIPLRGVGKVSFLRVLDVARAAARRNGELLAAAGHLDDPDDVFLLTAEEMFVDRPRQDLVAERRRQRAEHLAVTLPTGWRGRPTPIPVADLMVATGTMLEGIGVSPGVVEARARVVLDAADLDFEPGEILVAPYTDPSWGPLMFTAAALVVDIGGELSHAAVVARELGVPCVMGTGSGTRRLRTGDLLRVDGGAGTVEVVGVAP
ncbi:PEP-utilizing enzyme [Sporichthya polymorpha]|uniref:PEP-utilizing enzyme n=1 Tax=Sporichthya polymorpha TaxID=35751 RepID=UPI000364913E|nr:PEP-utilizing enzyme [Sporichthya polymorpha]